MSNFTRVLALSISLFGISQAALCADQSSAGISEATISSIQQNIKNKTINCQQLIENYLRRIKQYDLDQSRGAAINAFTELNPSALEDARQLDHYFSKTNKFIGPLHCIPVVIKDNMDTFDMTSTSGSLSMLGSQAIRDAFIVSRLRKAGAIILGKGAMDEFASGMIGISSRSGRVGNAYDPTQNPAGSSSGVAAAVSANFAVVGIGSDNSGSVRVPAAFNGIYGLRPSTGLLSQSGIFPRGTLDGVAGPMTRTVEDMAIVLSVIATPDKHDKKTLQHPIINSYTKALKNKTLKGMRFGIIRSVAGQDAFKNTASEINAIYDVFFNKLTRLGAALEDVDFPVFNTERDDNMAGEIEQINQYLASFPSTRKNFQDICQSGRTKTFEGDDGCLKHIKDTAPLDGKVYSAVLAMFEKNRSYVESIMQKKHLDALILPITSHGKATYDIASVITWKLPISSNSGLPSMVVNAGYTHDNINMPVGIEIVGKFYNETQLLQIAYAIEKNSAPRLVPKLGKPDPKTSLSYLTIPMFNNLLTLIGMQSYQQFLQSNKAGELTPNIFNQIIQKAITHGNFTVGPKFDQSYNLL